MVFPIVFEGVQSGKSLKDLEVLLILDLTEDELLLDLEDLTDLTDLWLSYDVLLS